VSLLQEPQHSSRARTHARKTARQYSTPVSWLISTTASNFSTGRDRRGASVDSNVRWNRQQLKPTLVRAVRKQLQTIAIVIIGTFDSSVLVYPSLYLSSYPTFGLHPFALAGNLQDAPRYIGESDPRSNPVELSVNTRWLDNGAMGKPAARVRKRPLPKTIPCRVKCERLVN